MTFAIYLIVQEQEPKFCWKVYRSPLKVCFCDGCLIITFISVGDGEYKNLEFKEQCGLKQEYTDYNIHFLENLKNLANNFHAYDCRSSTEKYKEDGHYLPPFSCTLMAKHVNSTWRGRQSRNTGWHGLVLARDKWLLLVECWMPAGDGCTLKATE